MVLLHSTIKVRIYNRWGDKIFDGEKNTPWLGIGLQEGPYAYIIEIINLKDVRYYYKGSVMLIK